jgi:hypothetical protein
MKTICTLLTFFLLVGATSSCTSFRYGDVKRKSVVVDDDGRSMRFEGGRAEKKKAKWNTRKGAKKNSYKTSRKRKN